MHVLLSYLTLNPDIGGPAHSVTAICKQLEKNGVTTRMLTGDASRFPPPTRRAHWGDLRRVDLVHSFGMWRPFSHAVCRLTRLCGTPYVLAPIGMLEPWALDQRALKKRIGLALYQRRDLQRATVVHVTAESEAQSVRALDVRTPIAVMPHGVDVPAELPPRDESFAGRSERVLLFLSRVHPKKGLLELVEAWARLRPKDWRVVVAGPDRDGHRKVVEAALERHGISRSFTFLGPVYGAEKLSLLRHADLFVLPTYSENFGLVIAEALGCGLPVLTTKGTPWQELEATQSGFWIDPGADALTEALRTVLALSPEQLTTMGENGRKLVLARYSWSGVISRHLALHRWIVSGGERPSFVQV